MGQRFFKELSGAFNSDGNILRGIVVVPKLLPTDRFFIWGEGDGKQRILFFGWDGVIFSTNTSRVGSKFGFDLECKKLFDSSLIKSESWRLIRCAELENVIDQFKKIGLELSGDNRVFAKTPDDVFLYYISNLSSTYSINVRMPDYPIIIAALDISIQNIVRTVIKNGWWMEVNGVRYFYPPDYTVFDHQMVRLPKIGSDKANESAGTLALWEFHNLPIQKIADIPDERVVKFYAKGRDPALDLKDCNVAIDFGTSSTVVAYEEADRHKLLRIGMLDFWQPEKPEHFENPTVLEFLDLMGMLETWRRDAYRPFVDWDEVRCAHTALASLRDNNADPKVVASILPKLKHWALNERHHPRRQFTDQKGVTQTLPHLTARMPVKGQLLKVTPDDPLDPIELYAWYLGLTINWRGRGIFLRYYMTFPVAYPTEVKDKILASFRRGLLRSLPHSMAVQTEAMRDFCVEERASEPAAYAAAALPQLGIAPTPSGVHYAVFDFGGGTTDFDFGVYRSPKPAEEDEGWEQVFEHYGADGDKFLGGENILENMVYIVFKHNLDVCRKHSISFSKPLDALDFPGSELLLDNSMATTVNNIRLASKLRPIFEGSNLTLGGEGMLQIDLLNKTGAKVACQLAVPIAALHSYLEQRIGEGVSSFVVAMHRAFSKLQHHPQEVHVLLAGNASRSPWVSKQFGQAQAGHKTEEIPTLKQIQAQQQPVSGATPNATAADRATQEAKRLFGANAPRLVVHAPLNGDPSNIYSPTAKTGVALGLLRLCPGSAVKVIDRFSAEVVDGKLPFAFHVGALKGGVFQSAIQPGVPFGQAFALGIPREGVFYLYATQAILSGPSAELKEGDARLRKVRLLVKEQRPGLRFYARATNSAEIEVFTACSDVELSSQKVGDLAKIDLGKFFL